MSSTSNSVAIVGAGIIGINIGLELQRRGFAVCLYDREPLDSTARASAGNAGAFAFTDVMPLATPGIMRKAPKWLFDPLGPLSIPPSTRQRSRLGCFGFGAQAGQIALPPGLQRRAD